MRGRGKEEESGRWKGGSDRQSNKQDLITESVDKGRGDKSGKMDEGRGGQTIKSVGLDNRISRQGAWRQKREDGRGKGQTDKQVNKTDDRISGKGAWG